MGRGVAPTARFVILQGGRVVPTAGLVTELGEHKLEASSESGGERGGVARQDTSSLPLVQKLKRSII